jgi:luciferase family oxidoreductase group 1
MAGIPLSVLDLSIVADGRTSADALAETTAAARRAEALGYRRYWVAEHHNMATVASTSPPVLMAHLAASTERIHVGSGGVMLPNHAPLVVAEQFAMLEALHPGRIDLGIGRAPGSDPMTAAALRGGTPGNADRFPRDLIDLMGLLGDVRADDGLWTRFSATPRATGTPLVVLLGSSLYSAQLAGMLGLPFGFAHHFDMGGTLDAVATYRQCFRPSVVLERPHTIVTANVLAAPTAEEATFLAGPGTLMRRWIRTGRRMAVPTPEAAAADPELPIARMDPTQRIVGAPDDVVAGLEQLAEATRADELMLSTITHGLDDRLRSMELVAQAWARTGAPVG